MPQVDNAPVMPDPTAGNDFVSTALQTVDDVLQYGRKKFGLTGGGQQQTSQAQAPSQGVIPTQSFADGGMVGSDEDDTDESGSDEQGGVAPVSAPPSPPATPQPAPATAQSSGGSSGMTSGNGPQLDVQQALGYLQGNDALPMPMVQRLEQGTGIGDPDLAKLQAIHTASQVGGPNLAWGLMQNYRKQYDLQRTNAAVKLANGALPQAAQAATQAYSNVTDGTKTVFQPAADGKGVTATVHRLGSNTPISNVTLSLPQFAELLVGPQPKGTAGAKGASPVPQPSSSQQGAQ